MSFLRRSICGFTVVGVDFKEGHVQRKENCFAKIASFAIF